MPVRFVAHRCITDVSVDVQMSRTEERCGIGTELPARFPDRFMTAVAVHYAPNRGAYNMTSQMLVTIESQTTLSQIYSSKIVH